MTDRTLRERLAALALEPGSIEAVAIEEVPALVVLAAALQAGLASRMMTVLTMNGREPNGDRLLTPAEAAARLGLTVRELYRRANRFPFTKRLGRRTLRFSEARLTHYLNRR